MSDYDHEIIKEIPASAILMSTFSRNSSSLRPFAVDEPNLPPSWEVISLAEALTWIAFHNSMDCRCLEAAFVRADPECIDEARLRLMAAAEQLANLGREGKIELTGKFVPSPAGDAALIPRKAIPSRELAEFRQFDTLHDGLRRGSGLTGRHTDEGLVWAIKAAAQEAYLLVEVHRNALLAAFPVSSISPMNFDEIVAWCRDWIESGKGSGMEPAWKVFSTHPRKEKNDRDNVFRPAWRQAKGTNS